ncbi:conserved exported hypothetical protein [Candidatus Zixiibacteriota bacterium]|nr:conserved exported hypothetical protein [candidate division Zixibacteria bacterium]
MKFLRLLGPIAFLAVLLLATGCERKVVYESKESSVLTSCFTCHGDSDSRLIQAEGEYANSVHASGTTVDYANRAGCGRCHSDNGFLDYLATGSDDAPYDHPAAIHCFTCHAPHTSGNLNLRTTAAVTLANGVSFDHGEGNLCANCHQARMGANAIASDDYQITSNRWGPHHSMQADILNGTNCYEIEGYTYNKSPHATQVTNACIGCHMANPQVHDGYMVGGHSWNMVDEESGSDLSSVCTTCHTTAESFDYDSIQTDVVAMMDTLRTQLIDFGVLTFTQGSYLPNVPSGDTLTIADKNVAGCLFDYLMIEGDRSEGVHNPAYVRSVLGNSIDYMNGVLVGKRRYGPIASH